MRRMRRITSVLVFALMAVNLIMPASVSALPKSDKSFVVGEIPSQAYNGTAHTPSLSVKDSKTGNDLTKDDYDILISKGNSVVPESGIIDAGEYIITVKGKGDYEDAESKTASFMIDPADVKITAKSQEFTYDSEAHSNNGYLVVGLFGSDALTAVVEGSITFPGESPVENKITSFQFTSGSTGNYSVKTTSGQLTMKEAQWPITIKAEDYEEFYDGATHRISGVSIIDGCTFENDKLVATASGEITNVAESKAGGNVVTEYKIMNGTEDVTANYVVTVLPGDLIIKPVEIDADNVTLLQSECTYNGKPQEPGVSVTSGGLVGVTPTEYTVTYDNNTDVGTATVTVKNVENGNYKIDVTKTFSIVPKDVVAPTIILSQDEYTFDGKAHEPQVTVKDGDTVIPDSEYTVSYEDNINAGTATVTVTDKTGGNYIVNGSANFKIAKADPAKKTEDNKAEKKAEKKADYKAGNKNVATGDENNIALFIMLMTASVLVMVIIYGKRKRR